MRLIALLLPFLLASAAFAETITLTDGKVVTGKILSQDTKEVKVDVSGMTMTYYAEEIKDIDGKPMIQAAPAPVPVKETAAPAAVLSPAKDDPAEKRKLILEFIDVFGTKKAMTQNFNAIIEDAARERPGDAQKIRERFKIDEVIERLIPLYDKYFTSAELKAYIEFYGSDQGQKLTSAIGSIMQESVQVGVTYVKEKFPELDK